MESLGQHPDLSVAAAIVPFVQFQFSPRQISPALVQAGWAQLLSNILSKSGYFSMYNDGIVTPLNSSIRVVLVCDGVRVRICFHMHCRLCGGGLGRYGLTTILKCDLLCGRRVRVVRVRRVHLRRRLLLVHVFRRVRARVGLVSLCWRRRYWDLVCGVVIHFLLRVLLLPFIRQPCSRTAEFFRAEVDRLSGIDS
jgi:hypothetical protein